jgi:hypothetical protein
MKTVNFGYQPSAVSRQLSAIGFQLGTRARE